MSEEELLDAMCQAYWRAGPGIRISMRSILELLHANGYRRCAEGQKVTQWCDRAEKAEAEVERLVKAADILRNSTEEYECADGMGRFALLDYWHEFDEAVDAARGES